MLLQFQKNPITDYQQVTNDEILPDFQNNSPSLDFIARKLRLQKSKCKENGPYYAKVIIFIPCSSGAEILKNPLKNLRLLRARNLTSHLICDHR
jgi:hypothetical protein